MDMNAVLDAMILTGILVALITAISWAGPCKKCRSWDNWLETSISTDNHQPSLIFEETLSRCSNCHKVEHVSTATKNRPRNHYDQYKY